MLSCVLASAVAVSGVGLANDVPESPVPAFGIEGRATLPPLKNTRATDRLFMREIGDQHVFAVDPSPTGAESAEAPAPAALAADIVSVAPTATSGSVSDSRQEYPHATEATGTLVELGFSDIPAPASTDVGDDQPPADAWARIRASDRLPPSDREAVRAYRDKYVREAMWVDRILERGNVFITHLVNALDERFLPVELALLPAIESGFRPDVHSRGQAAGLWQIVPITAREIGLQRNAWFDGRADTIASTTAALDYLSYLSAEFHGDWELTLAAYNAGPGRVRRAIRRNAKAGKPTDFWSLSLPQETRAYVPKMLALVGLLKEETPVLRVPSAGATAGFEHVDVGRRMSLDMAAELSGVPRAELERLNAGLLHGVTGPTGPHALYLPEGTSQAFLERLAAADKAELFSLPSTHEVVPGDTLSAIAQRYGLSQRRLMDMNALEDEHIRIGQHLVVIDARTLAKVDIEYVVTVGDSLSAIAQRHSVERTAIRDAHGRPITDEVIHPGETLMISVPLDSAG